MNKNNAKSIVEALRQAVVTINQAGGVKSLVTQLGALGAVAQAASRNRNPNVPAAPVTRGPSSTGHAPATPGATPPPPPLRGGTTQPVTGPALSAPQPATATGSVGSGAQSTPPHGATTPPSLAAATTNLAAAMSAGSAQQTVDAAAAYDHAQLSADERLLLANGTPPSVVALLVAKRKAQTDEENFKARCNINDVYAGLSMHAINGIRP